MTDNLRIRELMEQSGVKFGTSGARGLVTDMTDRVCYAYTAGFLQHVVAIGDLKAGGRVAVAGDLRSSTHRIMTAAAQAIADGGYQVVNCGYVPSPTVALHGLEQKIPGLMVTGSHIPDDRNGIKYNKASGEVLKEDEAAMMDQLVALPDSFDPAGALLSPSALPEVDPTAAERYVQRYLEAFPTDALRGLDVGIYEHSAVGRDLLEAIFSGLGAQVTRLGRSEHFIPVDTEAIRPEDVELAERWAAEHKFDALVSTDGDGDRPLISDENGKWLRGDVAGVLAARFLRADAVVTPVSCNTAVEKANCFTKVARTRIGSPYVIAQMIAESQAGHRTVVGYEANGGFLTNSPILIDGGSTLAPLPTRDPVIVQLAILADTVNRGVSVKQLLGTLPSRFTASDRLKEFETAKAKAKIAELADGGAPHIEQTFTDLGPVEQMDQTDGLRITFANAEVVHLRPSGNAPELRCYTEADSEARAWELNQQVITIMTGWR